MPNLVLYRKYRPIKFSQVINQEHVKTTLANAVTNKRVGHAYLFAGPRGVGKTTLARIFARAVNCPNFKDGEPCNECGICKEFLAGTSLDMIEIDAASNRGIDNVRQLIEHLQFAPTRATYKVIIVDEVHMLTKEAFNALLKTLEEPPLHAIFILATTEIQKVPATIISRTQRFDFKKISLADLIQLLKFVTADNHLSVTDESLLEIAMAADGSFRDALSLLDQVMNYTQGKITEDLVEEVLGLTSMATTAQFLDLLVARETLPAVNFVSNLLYQGYDLFQFQKDFLEYLRKILLVKIGSGSSDFGFDPELEKTMKQQADKLTLPELVRLIEIFMKAGAELKWAAVASLPLELAAVRATEGDNSPDPAEGRDHPLLNLRGGGKASGEAGELLLKVKQAWPQVLEKIKDYNHSLISSLKLAEPVAVDGKELVLTFPYKFHKDAIEARKNRILVDQVLEEVTGIKLMAKPVLQKDWSGSDTGKDLIGSALKIMGGEVE